MINLKLLAILLLTCSYLVETHRPQHGHHHGHHHNSLHHGNNNDHHHVKDVDNDLNNNLINQIAGQQLDSSKTEDIQEVNEINGIDVSKKIDIYSLKEDARFISFAEKNYYVEEDYTPENIKYIIAHYYSKVKHKKPKHQNKFRIIFKKVAFYQITHILFRRNKLPFDVKFYFDSKVVDFRELIQSTKYISYIKRNKQFMKYMKNDVKKTLPNEKIGENWRKIINYYFKYIKLGIFVDLECEEDGHILPIEPTRPQVPIPTGSTSPPRPSPVSSVPTLATTPSRPWPPTQPPRPIPSTQPPRPSPPSSVPTLATTPSRPWPPTQPPRPSPPTSFGTPAKNIKSILNDSLHQTQVAKMNQHFVYLVSYMLKTNPPVLEPLTSLLYENKRITLKLLVTRSHLYDRLKNDKNFKKFMSSRNIVGKKIWYESNIKYLLQVYRDYLIHIIKNGYKLNLLENNLEDEDIEIESYDDYVKYYPVKSFQFSQTQINELNKKKFINLKYDDILVKIINLKGKQNVSKKIINKVVVKYFTRNAN